MVLGPNHRPELREIKRESAEDEERTEERRCWKTGDWSAAPSPYRLLRDEITVVGKLVMRGMRIVIHVSLRELVLELAHERYQGIVKTKDRLRSKVKRPNMNSMVERHCKKCLGCQAVSAAQVERKPWQQELWKYLLAYRSTPHSHDWCQPC